MVSWWVSYLAKGPRPGFSNDPGDNVNCGRILAFPRRLFELDSIMAPSQANPILVRKKILLFRHPTNGLLVGAISGQGPRPNFNNGPGITRIVAALLPRHLFESDSNSGCTFAPAFIRVRFE